MQRVVEVGMFVKLKDSTFAEYGVLKGDIIYLAGDTIVSVKKDDPYMLRRVFLGAYVLDNHIDLKRQPFIVDGKRLEPVSKGKQAKLDAIRQEDFKKLEEV